MMRSRGQRTVAQVANDLGVNANQLHRWASLFEQTATAKRIVQGETLEEENRRLRKENERLRMEKTILKKSRGICRGLLREGRRIEIYRFILAEKANR
jgi:transposase